MTNERCALSLNAVEVRHLYYFAVVAEENNLRKAAERLYIAQPPLSRQIKQLEERLGVALFMRHSKGLTLTDEGARILEIIQPLLKMKDATFARLRKEIRHGGQSLHIGFTTAFEQGVFARIKTSLHEHYGNNVHIVRATSPKLVKDVRRGKLDAAFVALPLDAPGMAVQELTYVEPMVAALPEVWLDAENSRSKAIVLKDFSGKALFWFKREANPAFFDFTKSRFTQAGFSPHFIEEPAEHDVLLARIASGEGMGLFAASFAAIKREGVVFTELIEKDIFYLQLGLVCLPNPKDFVQILLNNFFGASSDNNSPLTRAASAPKGHCIFDPVDETADDHVFLGADFINQIER
ncbi:LysR family transcriptional regulator [Alphaproteobacteria bacterium]|nr:LysR family transcriptional regulator [Alphaproteobacteria bacterium]